MMEHTSSEYFMGQGFEFILARVVVAWWFSLVRAISPPRRATLNSQRSIGKTGRKTNEGEKKYSRSVPYEPQLLEDLKDLEFATGFLSEVLAQGEDSDEDFEVLFGAMEKVMRAQGMTITAKKMKMSRDALYKAFKKHQNPTVKTFREMLHAVDMEMAIVPRKRA